MVSQYITVISDAIVNIRYEAACKFLERNELLGIIRGHEAQDAGYVHLPFPSFWERNSNDDDQIYDAPKDTHEEISLGYHYFFSAKLP